MVDELRLPLAPDLLRLPWLLTYSLLPALLDTAILPTSRPGDVRIVKLTSNGYSFAPSAGIDFADINLGRAGSRPATGSLD